MGPKKLRFFGRTSNNEEYTFEKENPIYQLKVEDFLYAGFKSL